MTINVGVIGLGNPHARLHMRTLDASDEVGRVVIFDPAPALYDAVIKGCQKVEAVYDNVDDLLSRSDLPIVVVTMPNGSAPEMIARAAKAGKHVLCEKPCARQASDLEPALAAVRENDVRFTAFYTWRNNPAIAKMRDLVAEGALGRLTSVELRMVTTQVRVRNPKHWLFNNEIAGGGILSWLGCHWLDLLRFVTGDEVASVSALIGTVGGEAIDVEDVAAVSLRLAGGAVATLHAGYLLPSGTPGYEGASYDNTLVFRGTKGTLLHSLEAGEQVVRLMSTAGPWRTAPEQVFRFTLASSPAYAGVYGQQFVEDFFRLALTGEGTNLVSEVDTLRILQILDAIYESARDERVVHLTYDGAVDVTAVS